MGLVGQALAPNPLDFIPLEICQQMNGHSGRVDPPLVDPLVVQHLVLRQDVSVIAEELLCLLVDVAVHDVDEGRGTLQVLQVDVVEDPGVDDHVVLDVVVRHRDAAVAHLPLGHGHPVVVHLLLRELVVGVQSLGRFSQHQLHLA